MINYIKKKTYYIASTVPSVLGRMLWDPLQYIWPSTKKKRLSHSTAARGKPGELYAFVLDEKNNVFKVGKSINVRQRIRNYRTTQPDGYILHQVFCDDMDHAEIILHNILKLNGYHVKQEIFTLSPMMLKGYMDLVAALCRTLRQTKDVTKVSKMTRFIHQITN